MDKNRFFYYIALGIISYFLFGTYNMILDKILLFIDNALIKNIIFTIVCFLIIDLVCLVNIFKNKDIINQYRKWYIIFTIIFMLFFPYDVIYSTNYSFIAKWFNSGLFIMGLISGLLIISNLIYFLKKQTHNQHHKIQDYWFYIIPLISILIVWLNNYPGLMSFDSYYQLDQINSATYNDVHPAIHTLFVKFLLNIYDSPAIVILIQIVSLCGFTGYIFSYFNKKGMSNKFLIVSLIIWSSLAPVQIYTCYLWKDIPYTIGLLGTTIIFIKMIMEKNSSNYDQILLIILLTIVALFRHNGIVIYLISILSIILVSIKGRRYNYLISIIGSLLLMGGIKGPLYDFYNVQPNDNGTKYAIIAKSIVSVVANDGNYTEEELLKIENIMPYDVIKRNYNWSQGQNLLWNINSEDVEYGFGERLGTRGRDLISLFLTLFPKNSLIMIGDLIGSASLMWEFDFIRLNFLSVNMLYFFPIIIGSFLLICSKDIVGLIPLIPITFNTVSIMISNISYEARYAYPTIILSLFCFIYLKLRIKQLSDV